MACGEKQRKQVVFTRQSLQLETPISLKFDEFRDLYTARFICVCNFLSFYIEVHVACICFAKHQQLDSPCTVEARGGLPDYCHTSECSK